MDRIDQTQSFEVLFNYKELSAKYEKLMREMTKIMRISDAQSRSLIRIKTELKALLDNAKQGFLTFDSSLIVQKQYSEKCRRVFGRKIGGLPFTELIYPRDIEQREQTASFLRQIFEEEDEFVRDSWLELLPKEIALHGKIVQMEYRMISHPDGDPFCMAILTDITHERELETEVETERRILRMVVKAVTCSGDVADIVSAYRRFSASPVGPIPTEEEGRGEPFAELYRTVHTFKGNFGQLDFVHIVPRLHEFETKLSACKQELLESPPESLTQFVAEHRLSEWLEEDLTLLEQILGDSFLRPSHVLMIEEEKVTALEHKMARLLSPQAAEELLAELRHFRYRPFSELLARYSDWVYKAAANLGKPIYPLIVEETEQIFVDPERYRPFVHSLVHVFNNMLDHGIEEAGERAQSGKDPIGLIICAVSCEQDAIRLTIANDGREIDPGQIRAGGIAKGIFSVETASRLTDEELMSCIFLDGFSTRDEETALSGRGVGLAAVKRETERIGGSIWVESAQDAGTTFIFRLPFHGIKGGV